MVKAQGSFDSLTPKTPEAVIAKAAEPKEEPKPAPEPDPAPTTEPPAQPAVETPGQAKKFLAGESLPEESHIDDYLLPDVAVCIPRGEDGYMRLEGKRIIHMASARIDEEGVEWAKAERRTSQRPRKLPGHPEGCYYFPCTFVFTDKKKPLDGFQVFTIGEKHIYRVID